MKNETSDGHRAWSILPSVDEPPWCDDQPLDYVHVLNCNALSLPRVRFVRGDARLRGGDVRPLRALKPRNNVVRMRGFLQS